MVTVLPMMTAPAARSRATAVAVAHRPAAGEQRRAAFGRVIGGIEDVLDRHRHAVQRPERGPLRRRSSSARACASACVGIEMDKGMHLAVDGGDPLKTGAGIVFGGHVAAGDPLGGF